jgi:hypothetical protein
LRNIRPKRHTALARISQLTFTSRSPIGKFAVPAAPGRAFVALATTTSYCCDEQRGVERLYQVANYVIQDRMWRYRILAGHPYDCDGRESVSYLRRQPQSTIARHANVDYRDRNEFSL